MQGFSQVDTETAMGKKNNNNSVGSTLMMNPLMRKLSKIKDREAEGSADVATYAGIGVKSAIFLLEIVIGVAVYLGIRAAFINAMITVNVDGMDVTFSAVEVIGVAVAFVIFLFVPILAFLIRPIIPVAGGLYCISVGYIIAAATVLVPDPYGSAVWIALAATIALVASMLFLYLKGIIKVNHKFKAIVSTLFFSMIILSIFMVIAMFIPMLQPISQFINTYLYQSIGGCVIFIIIGCLMLCVDFEQIRVTVENRLPRKYEWLAAFALSYTVIYLYFKVLQLVVRIIGKSEN